MFIDLMTATGAELDEAGRIAGIHRMTAEFDDAYRKRVIEGVPSDGGPAFGEFKQAGDASIKTGGISVRDYFAAKIMAISITPVATPIGAQWATEDQFPYLARMAYLAADAMLAERAK